MQFISRLVGLLWPGVVTSACVALTGCTALPSASAPRTFLNPVLSGDRPDPSILKDGEDYYLVNSSFESYPGLLIWRSRNLVDWQPVGPALHRYVGSVWAPDLVRCGRRYFIYFPGVSGNGVANYVIWSDDIRGPWSELVSVLPVNAFFVSKEYYHLFQLESNAPEVLRTDLRKPIRKGTQSGRGRV